MRLDKNISYDMSLTSAEVNVLVVELTQLFNGRPDLVKALPNLKVLGDELAQRLATQDYNPKFVAEQIKAIMNRGLEDNFNPAKKMTEATEAETAPDSDGSKRKTKLSEVKKG